MATAFIILMWSRRTLRRFRVRLSAIGFHPKFKRYLHQISRCLLLLVPVWDCKQQTTRDFSAFGLSQATAELDSAVKMPR